jgi:hypothetical protein
MKKGKRGIIAVLAIVALLFASGCSGKNMSVKEAYQLKEIPAEWENPYNYMVAPMNPVLYFTGKYGVRHDMYVQEKGSKLNQLSNDNYIGFRTLDEAGMPVIVVLDLEQKLDFSRKAYIGSRDEGGRYHQYALDGKEVFGAYKSAFSWDALKPMNKTEGVKIYQDVKRGSVEDKFVVNAIQDLAEKVERLNIPGDFDDLLRRALSISSEEIFLGAGIDFTSGHLIGLVGVRVLPIIMRLVGLTSPQGPHLEKALVTNGQLGELYADEILPLKQRLNDYFRGRDSELAIEQIKALQEYKEALKKYEEKYLKTQ